MLALTTTYWRLKNKTKQKEKLKSRTNIMEIKKEKNSENVSIKSSKFYEILFVVLTYPYIHTMLYVIARHSLNANFPIIKPI